MSEIGSKKLKAKLLEQEITSLVKQSRNLKSDLEELEGILTKLNMKALVPIERIREFGLTNVTEKAYDSALAQTQLRLKISALIKKKNSELENNNRLVQEKSELLKALSICSQCNGKGMSIKAQYHREEEGIIQVGEETDICPSCNGTGSVSL